MPTSPESSVLNSVLCVREVQGTLERHFCFGFSHVQLNSLLIFVSNCETYQHHKIVMIQKLMIHIMCLQRFHSALKQLFFFLLIFSLSILGHLFSHTTSSLITILKNLYWDLELYYTYINLEKVTFKVIFYLEFTYKQCCKSSFIKILFSDFSL